MNAKKLALMKQKYPHRFVSDSEFKDRKRRILQHMGSAHKEKVDTSEYQRKVGRAYND